MTYENHAIAEFARILSVALLIVSASIANATPLSSSQFQSCQDARDHVARAGSNGVRIDRRPDLIYSDRTCFLGYLTQEYAVFEEKIKINGKSCVIGYSCIEMPSRG